MTIPTATYRLQFHKDFTFRDATALVPYLAELGISHLYASPFFFATPGSLHGYDVCDHNQLNPEVGTREELVALSSALREHGMEMIVDFVPNHMGIGEPQNSWWMNVLENGPSSPYAKFFDIDWEPLKRELSNQVLLPVLGDQYGRVLERGELRVEYVEPSFWLRYYDMKLPLAPRSVQPLLRRAAQRLDPVPDEFESILTALKHLPPRTETSEEKLVERQREKSIIADRLARLCREQPEVHEALLAEIAEFENPDNPERFDQLDALISDQAYRLSYWRVASEEINYRRFFDINTLAAIRMELPEVFDAAHKLLTELIAEGIVTGVRIDHIDGLARPKEYLDALQALAGKARETDEEKPIYLLVEKILAAHERLRTDWPIHGTTGYEFANQAIALLVDTKSERATSDAYFRFLGFPLDFREVVYRSKRLVMQVAMASEVNGLGHLLNRISESHRWYRDFTVNALTTAIREVIACFPVYRTYLLPENGAQEADIKILRQALSLARRRNPALERSVFDFLREVLVPPDNNAHPVDENLRREFVLKFQQCTGPITAKGVEDTAFYVFNRLIALNEVGGEPGVFGSTVETFHQENIARFKDFPHSLLATSTHDTKRSEDVRTRLAVLSEIPQEWTRAARRWHTLNRKKKRLIEGEPAPDANEEFLLYQTLIGAWPLKPFEGGERDEFIKRIQQYMVKALHEAKVNSSWIEPNEAWDKAVCDFVADILDPKKSERFLEQFTPFAARVAELGAINSLTQTILKLTVPGVPDLYQGSEIWDFSLVDPDNRRPVNYDIRRENLDKLENPTGLLESWQDGRIKQFVVQTLLKLRGSERSVFGEGQYVPVQATGQFAESCVAFERRHGEHRLLVVVPRLCAQVGFPAVGDRWQDTRITVENANGTWREVFSGRTIEAAAELSLSELFAEVPFAVLYQ